MFSDSRLLLVSHIGLPDSPFNSMGSVGKILKYIFHSKSFWNLATESLLYLFPTNYLSVCCVVFMLGLELKTYISFHTFTDNEPYCVSI